MDTQSVADWITRNLPQVETSEAYGYTFFFVGPDRKMPFATMASSDNEYDRISQLDRPGVFRLNIGVPKTTYQILFGPMPQGLGPAGVIETGHDFTQLDVVLPHPVYAPQAWICILSPSQTTFDEVVIPYLKEGHAMALERHNRRESAPLN